MCKFSLKVFIKLSEMLLDLSTLFEKIYFVEMLKIAGKTFYKRKGENTNFMADKMFENNQVSIIGEIVSDFQLNHEVYGEGFIYYGGFGQKAFRLHGLYSGDGVREAYRCGG